MNIKYSFLSVSLGVLFSICFLCLLAMPLAAATQIDIPGPQGSGLFGSSQVTALPNGNIIVVDPGFDITSPVYVEDAGAVFLYDGNGNLISRITGNCRYDNIGSGGVKVLDNGKLVISSPFFSIPDPNGTIDSPCVNGAQRVMAAIGAVTVGDISTGISGFVTPANSLVGSRFIDQIGLEGIYVLPNNNFVVSSINWNEKRGAATLVNSNNPLIGQVSQTNSLVGSNVDDKSGKVQVLANGNYVVYSPTWNDYTGSVTFCSKTAGCTGTISAANSLVGSPNDAISSEGITNLPNGNYLVKSTLWNVRRGAVTLGNGTTGTTGIVSAANSLVGSTSDDNVGKGDNSYNSGVTVLSSGNYVVISSNWDNGATLNAGAATFGNGVSGITGTISTANSLVGGTSNDFNFSRTIALTNGNYVVALSNWKSPAGPLGTAVAFGNGNTGAGGIISDANSLTSNSAFGNAFALANGNYVVANPGWGNQQGAVTLGNGTTGTTGTVSAANSLTGTNTNDMVGSAGITALTNGNYVVNSPQWTARRGAATFCSGTNGCFGTVADANSLTGSTMDDNVGSGTLALANGNYVVKSVYWNTYSGAVTFGNGTTGITGNVSSANSLTGTNSYDAVGDTNVVAFPDGNYIVLSSLWSNERGAATWSSGTDGVKGQITVANSLIGINPGDRAGSSGIKIYEDGTYVIRNSLFDNNSITDAGAVTLSKTNTPIIKAISPANSVIGTMQNGGSRLVFDYNPTSKKLVVGHPNKFVSILSQNVSKPIFDFDGDGKSDISVFRQSNSVWYLNQSTNGFTGVTFGLASDLIAPADFDGDGKTDIAVFRPSSGTWYYLRSSDNGFVAAQFGTNGDLPRPADYDGDGKADLTVFRPSNGAWYRLNSSNGGFFGTIFGQNGDKPLVADFDGDAKNDIAVFRPANATFYWINSTNGGFSAAQFGLSTDIPTAGDFDGDSKTDIAVFRPSNGAWYRINSSDGTFAAMQFGTNGDIPTAADFDGDGKTDIAVFRPSNGNWYYRQSSNSGFVGLNFGVGTDKPVPAAFNN